MSFIVFACACSTTNSKPFSTWFYFNNFVDVKFCGTGFSFLLHVSDWKGMFVDDVKFVFQQRLHSRVFSLKLDDFTFRSRNSRHDSWE